MYLNNHLTIRNFYLDFHIIVSDIAVIHREI